MSKYIDADLFVEMQVYDDEYEEWSIWNVTIEDLLNRWTEEGCPSAIEVSEDCISRQALIDEMLEDGNGAVLSYTEGMDEDELVERIEKQMIKHFIGVIRHAPPIEPKRQKGEWINDTRYSGWTCTNCNYHDGNATDNYCSNCGADMRGDEE